MSPEIAIPFIVFGTPVALVFIHKYFKFREKQLDAGTAHPKLLEAVRKEYESKQAELEARIENLESILIENDGELERRIAEKTRAPALSTGDRPPRPKALPAAKAAPESDGAGEP
ncbi:MAG TPA: hypothetical protein PKI03_01735 [Pseudomonadota bacterium]|nr:hypothetical protein [Pseudomonadota bacterium]